MTLPLSAQREILDLVVDDYTPLFDVTNVVKRALPSCDVEEQIELARQFVISLISRGYIRLYYDSLAKSTATYRCVRQLSEAETLAALRNRLNWLYHERRPPDKEWVTVGATPAGERALFSGKFSEG